jgi:iron complex transport system ATP-binding protein
VNIELQNLSCGYGAKTVVKNIDLTLTPGEIFCLLGPNGIGKTTLFKTILGFLPALEGSIRIAGKDMTRLSRQELARYIAYVPQFHIPPFAFRVLDVIVMGRNVHINTFGRPGPKDYTIALEIMERLGISYLQDRLYTELSGGERQMTLIARALAQEPVFLMMDEPTSNLDFGNQAIVLDQILSLAGKNLGIIMTTHYPEQVLLLETRVALLMKNGNMFTGHARNVLTAANLEQAYGIPVVVMELDYQGKVLPVCQPVLAGRRGLNLPNHDTESGAEPVLGQENIKRRSLK